MPCVVTISWMPLKKDAPLPNPEDYKDYALPKGMLVAYNGKPADPNEPAALELVNSKLHSRSPLRRNHGTNMGLMLTFG